jgi:hypothetical protein
MLHKRYLASSLRCLFVFPLYPPGIAISPKTKACQNPSSTFAKSMQIHDLFDIWFSRNAPLCTTHDSLWQFYPESNANSWRAWGDACWPPVKQILKAVLIRMWPGVPSKGRMPHPGKPASRDESGLAAVAWSIPLIYALRIYLRE